MKIEQIPIADLNPAKYNPRKISREELDKLVTGIRAFVLVQPIVINADNTIIGGHQRVKAAEIIGMTAVPCMRVDIPADKEKSLNIALNKISGTWDQYLLGDLLQGLSDIAVELTGFDESELKKMLDRTDEDNLQRQITSEKEFKQADDLADKIVSQLTNHIRAIAKGYPQKLNKAMMIIINKGRGNSVIFLADPNTRDVVQELKRYAESGLDSPLEKLTEAVWK